MSVRNVRRSGFALGAVLWVLTVGTVLGAAAAIQGRTAYAGVVLMANVALLPSVTATSIQATVRFNPTGNTGTTYSTAVPFSFPWQSGWSTGVPRHIAVPIDAMAFAGSGLQTGSYHYTLEVAATVNGATNIGSDTGSFVIVNRVDSPFGAGWWLDGAEKLISVDANQKLWIGGDGSARMYIRVGASGMYSASMKVDRPDSLSESCSSGVCSYTRLLPNKVRVVFNNSGDHVQTINALGHVTAFDWTGGKLNTITLPTPAGGPARVYSFEYTNDVSGKPRLSGVRSPMTSNVDRSVYVNATSGVVSSISLLGPADMVSFGYTSSLPRQITTRTDRNSYVTRFGYDNAEALTSAQVDVVPYGTNIINKFGPAETRGLTAPAPIDSLWTSWDGPRTDVSDSIKFTLNRFGAPDMVIGALNDTTTITRDAVWPALATSIVQPGGFKASADYDAVRGLTLRTVQWSPRGDGVNDTTTIAWDALLDKPTRITSQLGNYSAMTYDQATTRLLTKTTGGVTANFAYASACAGPTSVSYPDGSQDILGYDTNGLCNLVSSQAPLHPATAILRDQIGRVIRTISPVAADGSTLRTDTTEYDPSDLVLRTKSYSGAQSVVVQNAYDSEGRLLSVTQEAFPHIARQRGGTTVDTPNGKVWVENPDVGALTRTYGYDPAGRKTFESAGNGFSWSLAYDPAGNVLAGKDNGPVARTYDAKNRLLTQVGSDNASFGYDKAGRLTSADNQNAQVRRAYYPDGALREDTLRIVNPTTAGDFTKYEYVVKYTYDRDGRRIGVVNHLGRTASYTYDDSVTGNLKSITDVAGNVHRFVYDGMGRLDSLIRLSGRADSVVQKNGYDLASRLSTRYLAQPSSGGIPYYNESFTYDGRDKIVGRTNYIQTITNDVLAYTPLGQLANSSATKWLYDETFETDGLGMHRWHTSMYHVSANSSATDATEDSIYYTPGTTSVGMSVAWKTGGTTPDTTKSNYFGIGNLGGTETVIHFDPDPSTPEVDPYTGKKNQWGRERNASYDYSNENRMIASGIWMDTIFVGGYRSAAYTPVDSFKYDALGRRVFVRSIKPTGCLSNDRNSGCHSFDNHTIWDGDQILSEVRMAPVGVSGAETNATATGTHYGTVEYTHAGVIDQPISVARGSAVVLPLPDWSGIIDRGICATPGLCGSVSFPGSAASVYGNYKQGSPNWYGSLTEGQTDATGFQYKRNRYYDPASGQFTQEDPIGLAGGMNLYGYAGGDPVNYSDPFGLCTPMPGCLLAAAGGGGGSVAVGVRLVVPALPNLTPAVGVVGLAAVGGVLIRPAFPGSGKTATRSRGGTFAAEATAVFNTRPGDLPAKGPPNTSGAKDDGNGNGQIRDYGADGKAETDFDFGHDHGSGDPHAHDWDWTKTPLRQPGRPIGPNETPP